MEPKLRFGWSLCSLFRIGDGCIDALKKAWAVVVAASWFWGATMEVRVFVLNIFCCSHGSSSGNCSEAREARRVMQPFDIGVSRCLSTTSATAT